ncbi:MAG: sulfatase-like hydrolase/transferase [Myxococcota bacterium]|nr:sulfatase-like hydrolase/transferase [Myxococcota bacterium]
MHTPLLLGALLLTACNRDKEVPPDDGSAFDAEEQSAEPGVASRAVVLVLDGTRVEESLGYGQTTDGFSDAYDGSSEEVLSAIQAELLPRGGSSVPAFSTGVTITMPAHATLLQGRRRHYGSPAVQEGKGASLYRPELPTFFELIRKQEGLDTSSVALIGNTVNLISLDYSMHPGYGESYGTVYNVLTQADGVTPSNSDSEVVDDVRTALEGGARFVVANLHNIDRTAHNDPEDYADAVANVDERILSLWLWIQSDESGMKDDTVMVVTADHGRHRYDLVDPVWTGHGDDCSGCREIPLLIIGPGVEAGAVTEEPATLEDVHQTLAWLMGVESPYSDGLILSSLLSLEDEGPAQRSGIAAPSSSDGRLAYQQWRSDPTRRSEIVIDDHVFDSPEVFAMEAPAVLVTSTDDTYACWRQLELPEGAEYYPWELRCVHQAPGSSDWTDIGFPLARLHSDTQPALSEAEDGRLVVAVSDLLVTENINLGTNTQITLASWNGQDWELFETHSENAYAIEPSLQSTSGSMWLAYARGDTPPENRYTRHIELQRISLQEDGSWSWLLAWTSANDALTETYGRMEHAALWLSADDGKLAMIGFSEDEGTSLMMTRREAGGWSSLVVIDDESPLPHVRPVWSEDGVLFWARYGTTVAQLCRLQDSKTSCVALSSGVVERIAAVSGNEAAVSVLGEGMVWSLETVTF